jgi:hypothetical protein
MKTVTFYGLKFRSWNLFLLFVSATIFLSCSPSADDSESANSLDLIAVEELRIGQMEGDEEYVFGSVNYISVGQNDQIYVSDWQVPVIRIYDSQGKFISNVGREGRGPGEYIRVQGIKPIYSNKLAVWDVGNQRISIYAEDGAYENEIPVNVTLHTAYTFETSHNNQFYVLNRTDRNPNLPNWVFGWQRYNSDGVLLDTLQVPPDLNEYPQTFVLFTSSGDAHAFIEREMFALSPMGYIVTGQNTEYEITLHKPDGEVSIQRDYEPVPVRDEEKTQWRKWIDYYNVDHQVPDIKPPFKKIMTDMEGRIWVWRYTEAIYTEDNIGPHYGPESNWWEPPTFDVFNPDGSFYARVELPMRAKFFEARGNHVWALVKGEFDEQYVVRYRLEERGKAIQ